ncbi:ABC transporter permease [Campylobacter sp. CCUG 57310]|uniref:MlaE family ABC transporter permease n=1 Tax=Campylobacter sp. CCUG 57310 TaxID=2517362 RepID=UPI001565FE35|nr:ABC transporter permease [Campylobacter sp. CCUG 57310]QKF92207.1 lipid asymmetry ABC transporter MlaABCDEF, permease component MlaE [Campylobacter sp. CCUG 57310]
MFKASNDKFYSYDLQKGILTINLKNEWNFKLKRAVLNSISSLISSRKYKKLVLDFKEVKELDYAVAIFLRNCLTKSQKQYEFINLNESQQRIFNSINKEISPDIKAILQTKEDENIFAVIGEKIAKFYSDSMMFLAFLGELLIKLLRSVFVPKSIRIKEIFTYFQDAGINSVFIVCLTSFLVGIVLAYQGSNLLEKFGASIIIVEMMGMLTLREVAPLIAAIVVAGRLASSFTAQIGVMKITEEVDAMKTMGFDPFKFLVLPRVVALIIAMPLVVFLADAAGIFGEMVVLNSYLDISFGDYLSRFHQEVELRHLYVGLIKAPFFGAAIAFIGCMRGFQISGSTQSVGIYTTISVVNAIFGVIMLDALFSIIFTQVGI